VRALIVHAGLDHAIGQRRFRTASADRAAAHGRSPKEVSYLRYPCFLYMLNCVSAPSQSHDAEVPMPPDGSLSFPVAPDEADAQGIDIDCY
jgi:hypothetical protein